MSRQLQLDRQRNMLSEVLVGCDKVNRKGLAISKTARILMEKAVRKWKNRVAAIKEHEELQLKAALENSRKIFLRQHGTILEAIEASLVGKLAANIYTMSGARSEQTLVGKVGCLNGGVVSTEKLLVQEVKRGGRFSVFFWISEQHLTLNFVEKAIENISRNVPADLQIKVGINVLLINKEPSMTLKELMQHEAIDG